MKLLKTFLIASTFALVVSIGSFVQAQTLVATVNIENARIVSQVGNEFKLAFSLTNREGVQSGVRYGVKLVSETPKGQFVVDQEVFDEALTLSAGAVVDREVSYSAPANLDGAYTVFVTSMNEGGFPFATAYVGKATFSPVKKGLVIDPVSCKISVGGSSYTLSQTFSVRQGSVPTLLCDVTNYSGAPIVGTPTFKVFAGSPFGESVDPIGASTIPTPFLLGERKAITFTLPAFKDPALYYVDVAMSAQGIDTGSVSLKYAVEGVSASIDNFSFDKTSYKKGDIAKMTLIWRATLTDNSMKAKATPDVALALTVTNAVGTKCIAPVEQMLSRANAVKNIIVPVIANCPNPKAVVTLSDKEGTVLATQTFLIEGGAFAVSKPLMVGIFIALVVVLGIAIVLHLRKKKGAIAPPPPMPTTMVLLFLVWVTFGLLAPGTAHADTYTYDTPAGDTIITEVNLDRATYSPDEFIIITASIENRNNNLPFNRSYPVQLTANNNSGSPITIIPQTTLAPGITPIWEYSNFTAPDPAPAASGSYAVNFTTSVDTVVSGLSLTGFSADQGWIDGIGAPCWESSVTVNENSPGLDFTIRFDTFEDNIYTGQQSLVVTTGTSPWVPTPEYYGVTQGKALPFGLDYRTENVCVQSAPSNVYVDPAWLCN